MGLFRLLLALSVVMGHAGPILGMSLFSAPVAVGTFFVLSGFYMSLVMNEKYSGLEHGVRVFYINRFLRLYPSYLVVLVATVALQCALRMPNLFFQPDAALPIWRRLAYMALNLSVF